MAEVSSKRNLIGPNVQRIRESMSPPMTQERLAEELQMLGWDADRFIVSKIERGQRQVIDKEIIMIAKVLSVNVSKLFQEK